MRMTQPSAGELTGLFLERLGTLESDIREAEERHASAIADAERELALERLRLEHVRERIRAYTGALQGVAHAVSAPHMRTYFRAVEEYLNQAHAAEKAAVAATAVKTAAVVAAQAARKDQLAHLQHARSKLLWDERQRIPPGVDVSAIDQLIEGLPAHEPEASSGRECQRCAEPVARGRKRFCSRECLLLYQEESRHLEDAKRSRYYDYGTDDPEDERW